MGVDPLTPHPNEVRLIAPAGSVVVLIVGGRVFAGLLGGWIGDAIGYNVSRRKLAVEWEAYERERAQHMAGAAQAPDAATAAAGAAQIEGA